MAAAKSAPLRSVKAGEALPPKAKKQTVAEAAASGSYRDLLVATRDRIAVAVTSAECPPRDLAALTRRLTEIGKELAAIDVRAGEDGEAGAPTADEAWDGAAL